MGKLIESYDVDDWEVLSDDGWVDVQQVHKTIKYDVWKLKTKSFMLKCADEHLVINDKYESVYVKDLSKGDRIITENGIEKVVYVKKLKCKKEHMYDVSVDSKEHKLFTNGILSHNTTVSTVYLLHFILFNKDKNVALLANKEKTALQILGRIKMAFQMMPLWLQQGVKEGGWNKSSIVLENGMRLIANTTSTDSISGEAISLLYLDEFAKVKPHIAEEFVTATLPVVTSGKSSKVIIVSCVAGNTTVFTTNGIKEINDFVNEDKIENPNIGYEVDKYSVVGKNGINSGNVMVNSGYVKTNIIESCSSKLECSEEHKLWVCRYGEYLWLKSSEIKETDYISVKYGMDVWGNNDKIDFKFVGSKKNKNIYNFKSITKDLAYLIGLYISEGSIYRNYCDNGDVRGGMLTLTCGDSLEPILQKLGLNYYFGDGIHYNISSKYLIELFEYLGFDITKKSKEKLIPKRLMEMSRDNMIAMVQGIMDGDGSSQINKGTVCIQLSSKKLIQQLRMIFLNFGITTTLREGYTKPTKIVDVYSFYNRLEMGKKMSRKYYDIIGFRFERKQIKEKYLPKEFTVDRHDVIPYSKEVIFDIKDNDRSLYLKIRTEIGQGNFVRRSHFSRPLLLKHKQFMLSLNDDRINKLYENISEDIKWEPVKKIKKSKNKVYDFSLNDVNGDEWCHSVIYNGMVGHQTPLGLNLYYDFWINAVRGNNSFYPVKVNWWEHPDRDEAWKERTLKLLNNNMQRFLQEYSNAFLGSSNTLINPDVLEKVITKEPQEYKWGGSFGIFERPIEDMLYVLGIDTAKGTGRDSSIIQVLKIEHEKSIKQVAVYRNNMIDTHDYAQVCIGISKYYNNAEIMIENNGEGGETANAIWYEYEYDMIVNCDAKGLGIRATKKSKLEANLNLKRYLENGWLEINDRETLGELSRYIEVTPNVFKAETRTTHDDAVTSLLWGLYYLKTDYYQGRDDDTKTVEDKYNLEEDIPIIYYDG